MDLIPEILYEDADILAVNKPAGLVVHPDGRIKEPSVTEWFAERYPEARSVGEPIILKNDKLRITNDESIHNSKFEIPNSRIERPGVVHRIDRETSGVLLLAKTKNGFEALKHQFQNREVEKKYIAFLYGKLKQDHGTINLYIGKSNSDFRKRSAERGARGEKREAVTIYRVLARGENYTLVEAEPKTGRTHQIRVHFKALHHPVIADKLYAPKKEPLLGFSRLALHAESISFKNAKGEGIKVTAPYPEDFKKAFKNIGYTSKDEN